MIISVALLGIGASGTFLAFARGMFAPRFTEAFAGCAMLFTGFAMGGFALAQRVPFNPLEVIWDPGQQLHRAQIYGLLALPFFAVGTAIGLAFIVYENRIAAIYRADLIGAALGALLIIAVLYILPPQDCLRVVVWLGVTAASLAVCDTWPRSQAIQARQRCHPVCHAGYRARAGQPRLRDDLSAAC